MRFSLRNAFLAAIIVGALAFSTPASATSRTFLCFFDEGSAELDERCEQVLAEYAFYWMLMSGGQSDTSRDDCPSIILAPSETYASRTEILGHADAEERRRGISDRISADRTIAVMLFLLSHCIPGGTIVGFPRSAHEPLVPTDDAERQNRRVDIIMR